MLVVRTVAVPANSRAGIVADEECLRQLAWTKLREVRRALAQRLKPVWDRLGNLQSSGVEVVAQTNGGGQPLAEPTLEAKG